MVLLMVFFPPFRFARQADDEGAVHRDADLAAVFFMNSRGHVGRRALFDGSSIWLVAGLKAHENKRAPRPPAPSSLHTCYGSRAVQDHLAVRGLTSGFTQFRGPVRMLNVSRRRRNRFHRGK